MGVSEREAPRKRNESLPTVKEALEPHELAALEDVNEDDLRLHVLEARIREIDTKLSRATVFYGVRRLSHEGYRRYVESLRTERDELLAERRDLKDSTRSPTHHD